MILPLATLSTPVPDVDNYQLRKLLDTNILVSWITACLCFIVTVNHNQEPYVYFYYYPPPPVCILPMATTLTQLAPLPHWKPEKKRFLCLVRPLCQILYSLPSEIKRARYIHLCQWPAFRSIPRHLAGPLFSELVPFFIFTLPESTHMAWPHLALTTPRFPLNSTQFPLFPIYSVYVCFPGVTLLGGVL